MESLVVSEVSLESRNNIRDIIARAKAVKSGATFREILEAIEVGIEFGGGKATVSARFALEVMDDISKNAKG